MTSWDSVLINITIFAELDKLWRTFFHS